MEHEWVVNRRELQATRENLRINFVKTLESIEANIGFEYGFYGSGCSYSFDCDHGSVIYL